MGKRKKRAEAEPEAEIKPQEQQPATDCTNLETFNGDSENTKSKKKKSKASKENSGDANEIPTVTMAVAGSIIDNAQSLELATRLASQIARAAAIFRIDEIVVFDNKRNSGINGGVKLFDGNESGTSFLVRVLRYLETPQYLRKALFPKNNSLRYVGMLPPLDAPHHLRKHEWASFREGITLKDKTRNASATLVDVGLSKLASFTRMTQRDIVSSLTNKNIEVEGVHEPGIRVTVAMGTNQNLDSDIPRQVVSSSKPREDAGMYWGYKVRYASNISSVFMECPYKGGYDHSLGTSEHGLTISSSKLTIPAFRHLLIAFGGLAGLEESIREDNNYKGKDPREVFNLYLNTCPHQGSRTIRTEEAILISLQYFQDPINRALEGVGSQKY